MQVGQLPDNVCACSGRGVCLIVMRSGCVSPLGWDAAASMALQPAAAATSPPPLTHTPCLSTLPPFPPAQCLGRDLSQTIIVDNSPHSYCFQPENALPITTFIDDMQDQVGEGGLFCLWGRQKLRGWRLAGREHLWRELTAGCWWCRSIY